MAYGTVKAEPPRHSDAPEASSPQGAGRDHTPADDRNSAETASVDGHGQHASRLNRAWQGLRVFYDKNIGLFFVFAAQMFASVMSATTRLLETGFQVKFHALQVIFVRMLTTAVLGSLYMWCKKVPDFPLGARGVRGLLVLRGVAGTVGLFGLYYSLSYLDISDATVITFLVPTLTAILAWLALGEPYTVKEALAGFVAFAGVLFIARPEFLFPASDATKNRTLGAAVPELHVQGGILPPAKATPTERSVAVVCAVFGSFAAATAYATIRVIGKRTHSLVSVNYFAALATVGSFAVIAIHPQLQFEIPQSPVQWALLVSIGVSGFLLQVLLTEGLQREKAGRATNLIYTQMVFALIIERVVWGTTPPILSLLGGALIIGAAVWVSLQKKVRTKETGTADEERVLLPSEQNTVIPGPSPRR